MADVFYTLKGGQKLDKGVKNLSMSQELMRSYGMTLDAMTRPVKCDECGKNAVIYENKKALCTHCYMDARDSVRIDREALRLERMQQIRQAAEKLNWKRMD